MTSFSLRNELLTSRLYDEITFHRIFISDLTSCRNEVIIESPFITSERMKIFEPVFIDLLKRKVSINIISRDPKEHYERMEAQSEDTIQWCESVGIQVFLCTGNHHRKLAIFDRSILWEGSLNILSYKRSREIMRRIEGKESAMQMFEFLNYKELL